MKYGWTQARSQLNKAFLHDMAKQLSRKVFWIKHFGKSSSTPLKSNIDTKKDALERSISGFKHGVNLAIHVVLVGFNRNQIHFLPGFCARPQKEDSSSSNVSPFVSCVTGMVLLGGCSKILFKSSNLDQTKTSNTILERLWLRNNKNKKKA